jgi:glycosyltransferase involved in cell wall biosynthesis
MVNITVITSIFNSHVFLEGYFKAVGEIENAHEIEVLLIHNCPNENELAIINKYLPYFPFVRHIIVTEREGLYSSWNRAVNMAAGKYLAVWNVDDIRLPGSLIAQRTALDNNNGAAICYGDFFGTDNYGCFNERLYQYNEYNTLKKDALRRHVIGCFPMWRKEIHAHTGFFDEQFRLVGDFEFQVRVALQYELIKAPSILGYYLENQNHKLSSNRKLQDRERTVVELRYRMYDKILLHVLPFISGFRVKQVLYSGRWIHLKKIMLSSNQPGVKSFFSLVAAPFTYGYWAIKKTIVKLFRVVMD